MIGTSGFADEFGHWDKERFLLKVIGKQLGASLFLGIRIATVPKKIGCNAELMLN